MIETNKALVEEISFSKRRYFVKRDDLISKHFSGNKARKLLHFLSEDYAHIHRIISHGSVQSNALYSLSVLAKKKGWHFEYYVDHIPQYLRDNPQGNYLGALENNTHFILANVSECDFHDTKTLFIPEGVAMPEAEHGIALLAAEIKASFIGKKVDIFLPSGTGTTALYLQKQFERLEPNLKRYPTILNTEKKYHFGKLYREFFEIWIKLKQESGLDFDFLYDPKGWLTLQEHDKHFYHDILYIHQGGLLGNESMLKRYKRKFDADIGQ